MFNSIGNLILFTTQIVSAFPPMNQSMIPGFGRASVPIAAAPIGRGISNWPNKLVATYTYLTPWSNFDFRDAAANGGSKYYTLAFLVADSFGNPAWSGSDAITNPWYSNYIGNIRAAGGDIIMSFGGAAGNEIALLITDVNRLAAAYQSVIDRYALTYIDIDIEGSSLENTFANNRRFDALNIVARNNPGIKIAITIAAHPPGLLYWGKLLIDGAAERRVPLYMVNLMLMEMNYARAFTAETADMGAASISATIGARQYMVSKGMSNTLLGMTFMIGNNGDGSYFTMANAVRCTDWAIQQNYVRRSSSNTMNRLE